MGWRRSWATIRPEADPNRKSTQVAGAKNIFITGRPGIGKTTAILRAVELLDLEVHGFTTREIRQGRARLGFRIEDMAGAGAVMAHVDFPGPVKVGKYGVDLGALEAVGVAALRRAVECGTPAVIDEVGKMELASPVFVETLMAVVASEVPVLGTMHKRSDPTTRSIRAREDTRVIEITRSNRDELPQRLARMVEAAGRIR